MSTTITQPKYFYRMLVARSWQIMERVDGGVKVLCTLSSEQCAKDAVTALNRGLCEMVDEKGRWDAA